jgi:hypothetical protein
MCMFNADKVEVSNTCLFVAPVNKDTQVTVYSNSVMCESKDNHSAMVLPFLKGEIKFVDLSEFPKFFQHLEATFKPMSKSRGRGTFALYADSLEVIDVGSYQVSVVQNIEDFTKLDSSVFKLKPELLEFMKTKYDEAFSFIVCKVKSTATKETYHPLAYITNRGKHMFIPTMHFHPDDSHESHTDWDHTIYTCNSKLVSSFDFRLPERDVMHDVRKAFSKCGIEECRSLLKYTIKDYHQNHDMFAV